MTSLTDPDDLERAVSRGLSPLLAILDRMDATLTRLVEVTADIRDTLNK